MNNPPKLEIINGKFYLLEEYKYRFPWSKYKHVLVPKGTSTNFASIPSLGRALISPIDKGIVLAALVHDYLVGEGAKDKGAVCEATITEISCASVLWKEAAYIMKRIMKEEGASKWKAALIYASIRLFGMFKRKE